MAAASYMLMVEIELPDDCSEEYQDAMVNSMADERMQERLERLIKRWVHAATGENVDVTVSEVA